MLEPAKYRTVRRSVLGGSALASTIAVAVLSGCTPAHAVVAPVRIGTATAAVSTPSGTWAARQGFLGGAAGPVVPSTTNIVGTSDDALYRTSLEGVTAFSRPIANGTYSVTLKFNENRWRTAGARVFNVSAEGRAAFGGVDVFKAAGANHAYDKVFTVQVADGVLNLGFTAIRDKPTISGLLVKPATGSTTPASTPATVAAPATAPAPADAPAPATPAVPVTGPVPVTAPAPVTVPAPVTPPVPVVQQPGPSNTGVPSGTVLTQHYGNITVTTPGTVLDAMDIHGFVVIKAPNVSIRRSIVRGGVATTNMGLITDYGYAGLVVTDTELVPENPSVWIDAIKGNNYTAERIDAHGTVDAVKIHGDNVRVQDSWLHDLVTYQCDPNLACTPTHNDGVQILGGSNHRIVHNTIFGGRNSGIQVTQDYAVTTDVAVTDNWIDGGACSVNLANKPRGVMSGLSLTNNRFGHNTRLAGCAIIASSDTSATYVGNTWVDTHTPVAVKNGG
jgi:hypothetical protein